MILFISFECEILREVNVTLSQLLRSSLSFVSTFEVGCQGLGEEPLICVFFSFYHANGLGKGTWLSLKA